MIRRNTELRWLAGIAAGVVAAVVTGHAALTSAHGHAGERAAAREPASLDERAIEGASD